MTEQIYGNIYDYPQLYDILFSDMCRSEVKFLLSVFDQFSVKRKVQSLFEPASGSGRLLYHLAKLGFDVSGIDLNSHSVNYCNQRLKRNGFPETAKAGNMVSFSLADLGRRKKFDAAFNFVSSFLHLTTDSEAKQHLQTIAEILKPKGLYLIGLHLKPKGKQYCTQEHWSLRRGVLSVKSHLKSLSQDLKKRIEQIEIRIEAKTPKRRYQILDQFLFRIYSAKQFNKLLRDAGCFEVVQTYSFDYDISRPITVSDDTEDVVFILRKM